MIIDSHVHVAREMTGFWRPLRYGAVEDAGQERAFMPPSFDPTASPPEVLLAYMDCVGVDRAFMVQHHMYGDQNETVLEAVTRWPDRFVGFAYLGALDQADAADQLERLTEAGMAGLKVELQSTLRLRADFRFDGEREWRVWERLNQLGRPLIIDINGASPQVVSAVRQVIDRCGNINVAICHVGGAPSQGWEERASLARHPRVWLDLASIQTPFGQEHEYPYPQSQELIGWAVKTAGVGKLMWGTDYPGALSSSTYRQLIDVVRRLCSFLSAAEKDEILAGSALRFLRGVV